MNTDTPRVRVEAVRIVRQGGKLHTRITTVRCCWCGRLHEHGWPFDQATIGLRVAHCTWPDRHGESRSYYVLAPRGKRVAK